MPGLSGLVSLQAEQQLFNTMLATLNHHDYSIKTFFKEGVQFAHISVKQAEKGFIESADKNLTVLLHGEVFSIKGDSTEISNSAASFLKHITQHKFNSLDKVNGQFCACVYNHEQKTTHLISDRFGTRPLYYTVRNNRLLFAPEVKALLKDSFKKEINFTGIAELFSYGHLFGNKTLFEGIHLLPPAAVLTFDGKEVHLQEYWTYPYTESTYSNRPIEKNKANELDETLGDILIRAAKRQTSNPQEILLPLSGGLDSRYVAALYHHNGLRDLTTFTMGPDESGDQRYASQVATALGFQHNRFDIDPLKLWKSAEKFSYLADGMSLLSGPIQIFEPIEHFTKTKSVVPISQMCDAIYGSTLWRKRIQALRQNKASRSTLNEILQNIYVLYDLGQVEQLFHPDVYPKIKNLHREAVQPYYDQSEHPLNSYFRLLMHEHGRRGTLGGNVAINSLYDARMLSYDYEVFDFGWELPIAYREHQFLYRKTFARLFPELAAIKRQGSDMKIDASMLQYDLKMIERKVSAAMLNSPLRPIAKLYKPWNTQSYVNYNQWFKEDLRKELTRFLTEEKLASSELINPRAVKNLVQDHLANKHDNSRLLWQIVNLEHFYRNFMQ